MDYLGWITFEQGFMEEKETGSQCRLRGKEGGDFKTQE